MSDNITHTAILDDCFRLAARSSRIGPVFKRVIGESRQFARCRPAAATSPPPVPFETDQTVEALTAALDIGRPGRDGQTV
jgi:hypothetical protein